MKEKRLNFKTDLYKHRDFKFKAVTLNQWAYDLDVTFTTIRNRVKGGVLIKTTKTQ